MAVKIFFCYMHEDVVFLNKLKLHLQPLRSEGLIDAWYDYDIDSETGRQREKNEYVSTAHILLLLVSPELMNSDYCYSHEMKYALERHELGEMRLIPVLLRPVYWQRAPFAKLQVLPTNKIPVTSPHWHNWNEAFSDVIADIRQTILLINPSPSSSFRALDFTEMKEQEMLYRTAILNMLHKLYVLTQDDIRPGIVTKTEPLPKEWVERELEKMGETWRQDIYYVDAPLQSNSHHTTQISKTEAHLGEELAKRLIFLLSEDFLSLHLKEQLATFQILWERLKTQPLQVLVGLGQRSTVTQGIAFAGGQRFQRLLAILSTITWAIMNNATQSHANPEQIQATIAKEAEARGCSRALSYTLADYIQTHAPDTPL